MSDKSKTVYIRDLSMEKIGRRVTELLDKLQLIGTSEDARTIKSTIPLWVELTELRGKQLEYLGLEFAEIKELQRDNEERIMELESIPMTKNMATSFIHHMGLANEFEAFMDLEVDRVADKLLKGEQGGLDGLH
jgi:hypothetical protein